MSRNDYHFTERDLSLTASLSVTTTVNNSYFFLRISFAKYHNKILQGMDANIAPSAFPKFPCPLTRRNGCDPRNAVPILEMCKLIHIPLLYNNKYSFNPKDSLFAVIIIIIIIILFFFF